MKENGITIKEYW